MFKHELYSTGGLLTSTVLSKLKDFSRSQTVTYTWKWCKTQTLLLQTT